MRDVSFSQERRRMRNEMRTFELLLVNVMTNNRRILTETRSLTLTNHRLPAPQQVGVTFGQRTSRQEITMNAGILHDVSDHVMFSGILETHAAAGDTLQTTQLTGFFNVCPHTITSPSRLKSLKFHISASSPVCIHF